MRNSNPYNKSAFDFYKRICSKKHDLSLKQRLSELDLNIQLLFDNYDNNFQFNSLETLVPHGYIDQSEEDLKSLYDYNSLIISDLRQLLTTTDTGRIVKCQNCTINDINTLDHIVPYSEFCEFAIHPRNLFCCCSDCNARRNNIWRIDGNRTTLNLYLDTLPDIQYLFVEVEIGNQSIQTRFYLENNGQIDNNLYQIIESHYNRLNLLERFSNGSDTLITSLKTILIPLREFQNLDITREIILESILREREAFGFNYWQSILKLELINNDDFLIDFL